MGYSEKGLRVVVVTAIIISMALSLLFLAPIKDVNAVDDNVTIGVNVSYYSEISVIPTNLTWYHLNPGTGSDTRFLKIKNTGSANITNVYSYTEAHRTEYTNPLDGGTAADYAASSFLLISNESGMAHSHLSRLEWNFSDMLNDEELSLAAGTVNFGHGWYRNATGNWFLWKVENGTDGVEYCNATDTVFSILNEPENDTEERRDFTGATATTPTFENNNSNWSTFSMATGPLAGYCVAVWKDCDRIYIYKYNMEAWLPACNQRSYLRDAILTPGSEILDMSVYASIPEGTPSGDAAAGTLTIKAT